MTRRLRILITALMVMAGLPAAAMAGKINMRYGFKPGQQWECTRMTHMEFMSMGQKQVQRQKHKILYTVSKGSKKGWVRLTAQYIDPPAQNAENRYAMGYYDLTFSADFHSSGDTRNIQVQGIEKPNENPNLTPPEKMAMVQTNKMLAQSLQPAVFWFPELAEEPLEPGDEFEDKQIHGVKDANMTSKSKTRRIFVLEEVSQGLAYFSTKERLKSEMTTMGGAMDTASSSKGESIFDLKSGMWIEFVSKSKMTFSGAMMGLQEGQEMYMTEKMVMHKK